jgi:hypothetical protein
VLEQVLRFWPHHEEDYQIPPAKANVEEQEEAKGIIISTFL